MRHTLLLFLLCPGLLIAEADPGRRDRTVILDATAVGNLGIETAEAEETTFAETLFALGRIEVAPGHRAAVSSRIPGRVQTIKAHLDTPIDQGAEVAVVESRQPGDPPPTIRLTAPLSGLVSTVNVVAGQPIEPETVLLEIVDLQEVHAIAAVPEHLVGSLQIGQEARVRTLAYPDREFVAKLAHLGTTADRTSGTLEAAFHVENPELLLRPGLRAEFHIVVRSREGVMSIPREALQGDVATGYFVYIKDYELKHAFVRTPVQLGAQNDRLVEVVAGLLPGDEVVTRGAYSLAFAGRGSISLKEAMDAAHGHPHNEDGSEMTEEQRRKAAGGGAASAQGSPWTPLTGFLMATNGLLLLLLVLSLARRRNGAPASEERPC